MKIGNWLGQATTGAGFATILAVASSWASGSLSWQQALPLLVGGLAGIIWPENPKLAVATEKTASDISAVLAAYRATGPSVPPVSTAARQPEKK